MKRFLSRSLLIAAALLAALPTHAALNPAHIPADAKWVLHVDLDTLRTTQLGKELVALAEKMQGEATQGRIGIDIAKVQTTLGSLTAYGSNFSKDPAALDGTLIAQGTADLKKIAESLLLQGTIANPKQFSEVSDLPFPAYAIADGPQSQIIVAFPPEPLVLVSKSRAQLLRAHELFRGGGASLARGAASPIKNLLKNSEGAYFFGASIAPPADFFTADGPHARILKMASSGSMAMGETRTETFVHNEFVATDDATADKLMKILQGMTAMLSMVETSDKQLGEFLNATHVTRNEKTVTLSASYPTARILALFETFQRMQNPPPPRETATARPAPTMTVGRTVAEWSASEPDSQPDAASPGGLSWRTIENVSLKNGALITLGRTPNGGKPTRFDRVEIAQGASPAMTFRSNIMRAFRGNMAQFSFPGADGDYTVRVAYVNDPDGKTRFALSVRDPQPAPEAATK